ncbi:MAG: formimidoylglutamase, partial [Allomuricauda sp.]
MKHYSTPKKDNWQGRKSTKNLYLHEKVKCAPLDEIPEPPKKSITLLGYACDEGVSRNQGRVGAVDGPDAIKNSLGRFPNHLPSAVQLYDAGNITCTQGEMEAAQAKLTSSVCSLLDKKQFPIILGGGHDVAYGHYHGIKKHLDSKKEGQRIGIVNFDAHFDLRQNTLNNNSGTPFYQIAQECKEEH